MKKGIKTVVIGIILVMILLPCLSAMKINVQTLPSHKVSIFVLNPGEIYGLIDSKHIQTDVSGLASMDYLGGKLKIAISVKITKDGVNVLYEKLGEFDTNKDLYLRVIPGNMSLDYKAEADAAKAAAEAAAVPIVNQTEAVVTEENATADGGVTGLSISFEKVSDATKKIKWKYVGYALIAILIAGGVVFFFTRKGSNRIIEIAPKGRAIAFNPVDEQRIEEAERKLREAEQELTAIKTRKNEIKQAKDQYEDAKRKLANLGIDSDDSYRSSSQ